MACAVLIESILWKFHKFLQDLDELRECQVLPFTIVLKDPMGNSFIGTLNSEGDPEDDPNMLVEVSATTPHVA